METEDTKNVEGVISGVKSGLGWISSLRLLSQLLSWVATFLTIRFLSPEDYGVNAFAEIVFSILFVVASLGVDRTLVQRSELNRNEISSVFGVLIVVSLVLCLLTVISGPLLASYYDRPQITVLTCTLSICFLFSPIAVISRSLLTRDMCFKQVAICDLLASFVSFSLMLFLAYKGCGVWALIASTVAQSLIRAVSLGFCSRFNYLPTFDFKKVKEIVAFGSSISLNRFVILFTSRSYIFIGGYYLGAELMGYYVIAMELAMLPLAKLMPVVTQVAFPALSKLKANDGAFNYYYLKGLAFALFLISPIMYGLGAVSERFTGLVLGERWLDMWQLLMLLCFMMPAKICYEFFVLVIQSKGSNKCVLYSTLVTFVFVFIGVLLFGWLGWLSLMSIVMFSVIEGFIGFFCLFIYTNKQISLSWRKHLGIILKNLFPSVLMAISVVLATFLWGLYGVKLSDTAVFSTQVVVGALLFCVFAYFLSKQTASEFFTLLFKKAG